MKHINTRRGFTLMELLVVVLIIGILAAVAVPQYKLAVNKSRFAKLQSTATSLVTAANAYRLANGTWPESLDVLDIDLPGTAKTADSVSCRISNEMNCCIIFPQGWSSFSHAISCERKDYSFIYYYMLQAKQPYCVADQTNADALKLCQAVSSKKGWWIKVATSKGVLENYPFYTL